MDIALADYVISNLFDIYHMATASRERGIYWRRYTRLEPRKAASE